MTMATVPKSPRPSSPLFLQIVASRSSPPLLLHLFSSVIRKGILHKRQKQRFHMWPSWICSWGFLSPPVHFYTFTQFILKVKRSKQSCKNVTISGEVIVKMLIQKLTQLVEKVQKVYISEAETRDWSERLTFSSLYVFVHELVSGTKQAFSNRNRFFYVEISVLWFSFFTFDPQKCGCFLYFSRYNSLKFKFLYISVYECWQWETTIKNQYTI